MTAETTRSLDRRIFVLALPALGALAADPLLSLVDTYFVSRLGVIGLGALAVNTAVFGFAFVLFNFLAYVTTPLVARALGAGRRDEAAQTVSTALGLGLLLGLLATVVLLLGGRLFLELVQTGPEVMDPALSYLRIRALAAPAVLVTLAAQGAFRGFSDTKTPLYVALIVNLLNGVLDPLLIFGFDLGVAGAATASVIAQIVGAGLMLVLLHRRLGGIGRFRLRQALQLLRPGALITVRTLFLVTTLAWATSAASVIGTVALAAHQVVRETWFLTAMIIDGLAIAAMSMIAESIGRERRDLQRRITARLYVWGTITGVVLALGWWVGTGRLAAIFAPNLDVAGEMVALAPILALMAIPAAWLWVADGVVLGQLGLARMAVSSGAGLLVAGLLLDQTIDRGWGLSGVWWAIGGMVIARLLILLPVVLPGSDHPASGLGKEESQKSGDYDPGAKHIHRSSQPQAIDDQATGQQAGR